MKSPAKSNSGRAGVAHQQLVGCFFDGAPHLIHCAFRYYLGRMTIATGTFAQDLANAWPLLPENTARMIQRELEEAFKNDDEARARGDRFLPLGHDMDRQGWEKVRGAYSANEQGMAAPATRGGQPETETKPE